MKTKLYAALVALLTVGTVVTVATPAQADTIGGSCPGNSWGTIWLEASTTFWVDGAGWQFFSQVEGSIHSYAFGPEGNIGNQNNVNLYLYQDGAQNWAKYSPDNIPDGGGFQGNPNRNLPPWSSVWVKVNGIFDKKNAPDPECDWYSPVL